MADVIVQIKGKIRASKNKCLQLIAEEGEKELKKNIMKNWYGTYPQRLYKRTKDFYNSAEATVSEDKAIIRENPDAFSASESDVWNQHMSFDGSPFVGEDILNVLEFGANGGLSPRSGEAAKALEATEKHLKSYIPKALGIAFGKIRIK